MLISVYALKVSKCLLTNSPGRHKMEISAQID
ncbi:MAG: hypothetical protein ACI9UQ_002606, partial [Candidatus Krumholzibacteriia bacterium]